MLHTVKNHGYLNMIAQRLKNFLDRISRKDKLCEILELNKNILLSIQQNSLSNNGIQRILELNNNILLGVEKHALSNNDIQQILELNKDIVHRVHCLQLQNLYLMQQSDIKLDMLALGRKDSSLPDVKYNLTRLKLEITRGCVVNIAELIQSLTESQCRDIDYLEHTFIPLCGLSDDPWWDTPEIAALNGKALHLLQYPCQLAPFLAWLADNASGIRTYLEIGVRWGGTFILISEWLRRFSPELEKVVALDCGEVSPLILEYTDYLGRVSKSVKIEYIQEYSTSSSAKQRVMSLMPQFVFVDGDHRYECVKNDYELVRNHAQMILFHDISNENWPGAGRHWRETVQENAATHDMAEFIKQYPSSNGHQTMGLGVIKRRKTETQA